MDVRAVADDEDAARRRRRPSSSPIGLVVGGSRGRLVNLSDDATTGARARTRGGAWDGGHRHACRRRRRRRRVWFRAFALSSSSSRYAKGWLAVDAKRARAARIERLTDGASPYLARRLLDRDAFKRVLVVRRCRCVRLRMILL